MNKIRKIFLAVGIISIIILMPSCQQKKEITEMAKVLAVAIDDSPDGGYILTVEALTQGAGSDSSMSMTKGGQQSGQTMIFSSTGPSVLDAMNNLSGIIGKEVRFSHNKIIIIGEDLAKRGVAGVVDFSLRFQQMRPNIPIIVSKGKAYDILNLQTLDVPIVADVIENMLYMQDNLGYAPLETNLRFANDLGNRHVSPVCGVIKKSIDKATKQTILILEGTAVFKDDKLIGYLNRDETRGLNWILGRVKTGDIVVPYPDDVKSTLYIINSHSKVKPEVTDGRLTFNVIIDEKSNLREMRGNFDPVKDLNLMDKLGKAQDESIKKEIHSVIEKSQKELKVDIFGFADEVHKDMPKEWYNLQENWEEEFSNCNIEIHVNSKVLRPGTISKPIY